MTDKPVGRTPSFYDATKRLSVDVDVSWGKIKLETMGCLDYVAYRRTRHSYVTESKLPDKLGHLATLISLAIGDKVPELLDIPAILPAMALVNPDPPELAWQKDVPDPSAPPQDIEMTSSAEYDGRELAWMVSVLAATFGWSSDHILRQLTYYEASCYVQEALMIEHERREFVYLMSETGFKKVGDDYVKEPFPKLPWRIEKPVRTGVQTKDMPEAFKPDGVIIDLTNPDTVRKLMGELK